jgi:hypothetical protein
MKTQRELDIGIEIEKEHGGDIGLARKIAADHLSQDPNYYSKLMAAGLGDEPTAQVASQVDRAFSGQGTGNVSLAQAIPAGAVEQPQPNTLKSSNIGTKSQPELKSSNLKLSPINTVASGKTVPKMPEPTIETGAGLVNKTTGAKIPHGVSIKKTPNIGANQTSSPTESPTISQATDPLNHFCGQVDAMVIDFGEDDEIE